MSEEEELAIYHYYLAIQLSSAPTYAPTDEGERNHNLMIIIVCKWLYPTKWNCCVKWCTPADWFNSLWMWICTHFALEVMICWLLKHLLCCWQSLVLPFPTPHTRNHISRCYYELLNFSAIPMFCANCKLSQEADVCWVACKTRARMK